MHILVCMIFDDVSHTISYNSCALPRNTKLENINLEKTMNFSNQNQSTSSAANRSTAVNGVSSGTLILINKINIFIIREKNHDIHSERELRV